MVARKKHLQGKVPFTSFSNIKIVFQKGLENRGLFPVFLKVTEGDLEHNLTSKFIVYSI